jgi:hypothetical protein
VLAERLKDIFKKNGMTDGSNFAIEDGLAFDQQSNSLNHHNSRLFNVLEQISTENLVLASPTGFEPVLPP